MSKESRMFVLSRGAIIADDDIMSREQYTCTLKCVSLKGTLYEISKENFKLFQGSTQVRL